MQPQNSRTFDFKPRKKIGMPPKPKRWSHQNDLDALVGKNLIIGLLDIGDVAGKLLAADQFTLKMELKSPVSEGFYAATYFKSALTYYREA